MPYKLPTNLPGTRHASQPAKILPRYISLIWFALIPLLLACVGTAHAGVGNWTAGSGMVGADITALAVDASGNVYAGAKAPAADGSDITIYGRTSGVIYKSRDGGASWQVVNGELSDTTITALAIDGAGSVYAGTAGRGVYKSSDGGTSWAAANTGIVTTVVNALSIDAQGVVYAAIASNTGGRSGSALLKSSDGGASWVETDNGLLDNFNSVNSIAIAANGTVYIGTSRGVYKSTDKGATWSASKVGLDPYASIISIAVDAAGSVYAGPSQDGVYKSSDGGTSWTAMNAGLSAQDSQESPFTPTVKALLSTANGQLFALTDAGAFTSRNGADWSTLLQSKSAPYIECIAIDASGNTYLGTVIGVIKISRDGTSWPTANNGFPKLAARSLVIDAKGSIYAGMDKAGVFKSVDGGASWAAVNRALGQVIGLGIDGAGNVYAGANGGPYKSSNGGGNWTTLSTRFLPYLITALGVDPLGDLYVGTYSFGHYNPPFRSTDGGASWTGLDEAEPVNFLAGDINGNIYALAQGSLYKGNRQSLSMQNLSSTLPMPRQGVNTLLIDAHGSLYIGLGRSGVLKSTDGGASWLAANAGIATEGVVAMAMDASGAIYAVANGGNVYKSQDGGASWSALNTPLPANVYPKALAVDSKGVIYVATAAAGVLQYTPPPAGGNPRLVNVSTRLNTQTGDNVAIAGFIISGGNKTVLIRALGPSLAAQKVPMVLADPRLRLFDSKGNVIASNDNWGDGASVDGVKNSGGAPSDALEGAILITLAPGSYTAIMDGVNGLTGNGLVSVDGVSSATDTGTLANLSTRGLVGIGDDVMIAGFIIADAPRTLLISARGPSLSGAGVAGALADPTLELHDATGAIIDSNDNVCESANVNEIAATGHGPSDCHEAALLRTLPAGAYTAIVRGSNGTQGVALVSVDLVN